jgi:hypothetical protein
MRLHFGTPFFFLLFGSFNVAVLLLLLLVLFCSLLLLYLKYVILLYCNVDGQSVAG